MADTGSDINTALVLVLTTGKKLVSTMPRDKTLPQDLTSLPGA